MSFLSRTTPVLRQSCVARPSPRLFSTAVVYQKTVTDTLKSVDRTVSDAAVKGIDKGAELKEQAAAAAGINADKASGEAHEKLGETKGKAAQLSGQAQGKASEIAGQAKGKAAELKGKLS